MATEAALREGAARGARSRLESCRRALWRGFVRRPRPAPSPCPSSPARALSLPLPCPRFLLHTLSLPRFLLFFYSSYAPSPSLFSSRSLPVSFPFSFFFLLPLSLPPLPSSLLHLTLFLSISSSYLFPRPSSLPSLPLRPFILPLFILSPSFYVFCIFLLFLVLCLSLFPFP